MSFVRKLQIYSAERLEISHGFIFVKDYLLYLDSVIFQTIYLTDIFKKFHEVFIMLKVPLNPGTFSWELKLYYTSLTYF